MLVQMDSPVMLMPIDEYETQDVDMLYYHTFITRETMRCFANESKN